MLDTRNAAEITVKGVRVNATAGQPPIRIDGHATLPHLFRARCRANGAKTAHREKHLGIWQAFSWADYYQHAKLIGLGLKTLGLERGDPVSILSEDNKEWMYIDMGAVCVGGVSSGVYTTDSASQLAYLVNDSGSKFLFVENDEQLDKFLEVEAEMPGLRNVIILDPEGLHDFRHPKCMFLSDLYDLGRKHNNPALFEDEIDRAQPEDLAVLIYTSGTTGLPKG